MARCKTPGKLRYPSWAAATEAAVRQPQRNIKLPLMAYRCPSCGGWHLSTHNQRPARRR